MFSRASFQKGAFVVEYRGELINSERHKRGGGSITVHVLSSRLNSPGEKERGGKA